LSLYILILHPVSVQTRWHKWVASRGIETMIALHKLHDFRQGSVLV
jgi:hypothetical protein